MLEGWGGLHAVGCRVLVCSRPKHRLSFAVVALAAAVVVCGRNSSNSHAGGGGRVNGNVLGTCSGSSGASGSSSSSSQ